MLVESFSGVRGVYGADLNAVIASDYAAAYAWFLDKKTIVIGRDTRPSSLAIHNAMVKRLSKFAKVITLGVASTPATEFMVRKLRADGGIMITASHNEPKFNGWKFLSKTGAVLSPTDMKKVIKAFRKRKSPVEGRTVPVKKLSSVAPYVKFLLSFLTTKDLRSIRSSRFKVWFDPNGGAAIPYLAAVSIALGLRSKILNGKPGGFSRLVEPNEKSLYSLTKKIPVNAIGIGFDCDADRAELFTKSVLSGQYVLALVVQSVLNRTSGPVVTNDATSGVVSEVCAKFGADLFEVEVGETNVVMKMEQIGSRVGGEGSSSGGIVFPSRCRDGLLSLVMILRYLASTGKSLEEVLSDLPIYYTPRKNLKITPRAGVIESLAKKLKKSGAKVIRNGGKDGSVKGVFSKGWVWFRQSKTEAGVFRVISDSKSEREADRLLKYGVSLLK